MIRAHRIAPICCFIMALAPKTMSGAGLSATAGANFFTDGAADCLQTSGGGFGTPDAPLIGCLLTFGTSMFQSRAAASAAFGTLRVLGSSNYTNLNVPSGNFELSWFLRADADIADTLTIPTGSFLDLTVDFSGTESNAGAFFFIDGATRPYTFPGPNTFRIPFRAGVPFALDLGLRVDLSGILRSSDPQGQSFARFVDLSHTVRLVSTQVFDSLGNPIAGVPITSDSGFDYNNPSAAGGTAPEPATLGCMAIGLAGVIGFSKRKWKFPRYSR